jgi:hypothetical protein
MAISVDDLLTVIKVLTTEEEEMLDQVARVEASHGPQT